ncbi:hypothetical protein [Halosegnis longus]|uniref:hypothetical protein n=1 Tax=Halosegnis longus TaxID=2216012 RepID=UPI00129DC942|nr:hypothetical protein [Halosegnis longus]
MVTDTAVRRVQLCCIAITGIVLLSVSILGLYDYTFSPIEVTALLTTTTVSMATCWLGSIIIFSDRYPSMDATH